MKETIRTSAMTALKLALVIVFLQCAFTSCKREHLYYGLNDNAIIKLEMDWTKCGLKPNGTSVYAYNADGTLYKKFDPFNNPDMGTLILPIGKYKLFVFNNTIEEYEGSIDFSGVENWKTFKASIPTTLKDGQVTELQDTLATARVLNLEVNKSTVKYYYDKPDAESGKDYSVLLPLVPERQMPLLRLTIHSLGMKYASQVSMAKLSGLSSGCYLCKDSTVVETVPMPLTFDAPKYVSPHTAEGSITAKLNTFGLKPTIEGEPLSGYTLEVDFLLVDGKTHSVKMDISDKIRVVKDERYGQLLDVSLDVELPMAVGGQYHPDVNGWADEVHDVEI